MSSEPPPAPGSRLGFLLKHANLRLTELNTAALAPLGIDGRELGVLLAIGTGEPPSQLEAANRLGIDRTTMVAMLDALEGKGVLTRHPDADDRRRNVVELTASGHETLAAAVAASDAAERDLLAALPPAEAAAFRAALRAIVEH